jgi:signal transduction histidine kinase
MSVPRANGTNGHPPRYQGFASCVAGRSMKYDGENPAGGPAEAGERQAPARRRPARLPVRPDGPMAANAVMATPDFLAGGGEMGARMRAKCWADTPLGPPEVWPQSLRTVVRILLTSRYAMWMGWGKDLTFFYNDAYAPTLGVKQAWALGSSAREVWKEIWSDIGPRIEHVLAHGEATWDEGLLLFLERSEYPEETYHTFSYSPLADDSGEVVGMLCVVTEETERIIGDRRLSSLRELASEIAGRNTQAEVLAAARRQLDANRKDLPFTLTYLFDRDGRASLACATGIAAGHAIAPATVDPAGADATWPAGEVLARRTILTVGNLERRDDPLPTGAWDKPPREAVVAPIGHQGHDAPAGFLVAAVNPYRRLDEAYLGFINLVAGQIASGLANAHAYEAERQRAEALAEIDRAKTTFFSNVSHEFRTPLTLMLSPLEDALARPDVDPLSGHRSLVQVAHRNGVRLLKLVNTLLDFSRIEAGRVQASFEPVDLAGFTAELASNFRSAIEKAGLRLMIDCPPLPQQVHIDRDMWEKIVLNLVSNAFKFTLDGEIAVAVRPSADRSCAEVVVRDTGTGIPPDELPHLFERFHRVDGARGRSIEGSGIGLALVQELVRLHGGTISVTSEIGRGSAFRVVIPFGTAHLPADRIGQRRAPATTAVRAQAYIDEAMGWLSGGASASEKPPSESDDPGDTGAVVSDGQLVLLADDNADMRQYVQRLLHAAGFRVNAVADGEQALAAARRFKPDLVLSDVMMPRLDGFGLLAALRNDPDLRETPVLLLSARAGEEAKVEGLSAGADDYLTKPFSARELLARVGVILQLARARRETARALEDAARLLEVQVARRTAELAAANELLLAEAAERERVEGVLRQAQKMEGIGQLTGGVAHDFNNLLTIIVGNLEAMQRQLQSPAADLVDVARSADGAMRGAQRAVSLTQRLLAFSRQQPLDPKPMDVSRLITGMSDLLRRTIGEHIAIETVLAGGLWRAHVDANQLEIAILNLAVNARDAMPEGGKLTIETANAHLDEGYAAAQAEVVPGQYIMLAITDNGSGMTREVLAKAFEPFFTTKDVGHGTGLGLSQVYGFVKQSGGHVKIYSEPGEGTSVKIYLPRLHSEEAATTAEAILKPALGDGSETVLVVEDDDDVRKYTRGVLGELGYRVLEAASGTAALDIIDRQPEIQLLFTDVGLPGGMNGRQLAEEARRRRPGLKVLFTTGYARNAIVHDGRLDPGVQLITKPFTYAALAAKLRGILDARVAQARILVVEDEVLIQMLAIESLEELGFMVEVAGTAADAKNKLRLMAGQIDAAIIDVGLPDAKGDVLVRELRAIYPTLPIVIASGHDEATLRERFKDQQSIRFLNKPYALEQLRSVLQAVGISN